MTPAPLLRKTSTPLNELSSLPSTGDGPAMGVSGETRLRASSRGGEGDQSGSRADPGIAGRAGVGEDFQRALSAVKADPGSAAGLLALVYEELRALAARKLEDEDREHILQPTALVHEAWLKLAGGGARSWQGRQQFFLAASEAMRWILVDRARRRQAAKRGGDAVHIHCDGAEVATPETDDRMLALDDALAQFAEVDSRKAELVQLRYFVGMSFEEASRTLGIAVPTAKQWWAYARAWLRLEMDRENGAASPDCPAETARNAVR